MPKNTPERIIDYPASSAGRASTTTAGATSTATTLADHAHDGGLGSGGTLVTPSAMSFVLESITATVQAALVRLDTRSMMEKSSVDTGDSLTVPAGWQMLLDGPYTVDGTITIDGKVVVL